MKVVFIGCGNMGTVLLKTAVAISEIDQIVVVEKRREQREKLMSAFPEVLIKEEIPNIEDGCFVVMAVKPQDMDKAVEELKEKVSGNNFGLLSIAAGITRRYYQDRLGISSVIRAMPNTPGLLGAGITAVIYDQEDEFSSVALKILEGLGEVIRLEQEEQIDLVTAISGSGPAYFFYLVEALKDFGIEEGLREDIADRLARRTCYGAGILLDRMEISPKELRKMVTSRGGTTEAAINYMTENGISGILKEAFNRAKKRAKELAR